MDVYVDRGGTVTIHRERRRGELAGCRGGDSGRSRLLSGGESRDVEAGVLWSRVVPDEKMEIGGYTPAPWLSRTLHKPLLFILSLMQLRD